jgi:hypothetical protein
MRLSCRERAKNIVHGQINACFHKPEMPSSSNDIGCNEAIMHAATELFIIFALDLHIIYLMTQVS